MTVSLWRLGTDSPAYTSDDMSGTGAKITGGRWNREGSPVIYTATNIALACLETVVHSCAGGLPLNRYLVRIEVPDDIWARATIPQHLPVGWDALPTGKVSLDFGEAWLADGATSLLLVPSVVVPEEPNVLINPAHPDASRITATKVRKWLYDARLRA